MLSIQISRQSHTEAPDHCLAINAPSIVFKCAPRESCEHLAVQLDLGKDNLASKSGDISWKAKTECIGLDGPACRSVHIIGCVSLYRSTIRHDTYDAPLPRNFHQLFMPAKHYAHRLAPSLARARPGLNLRESSRLRRNRFRGARRWAKCHALVAKQCKPPS